jgi:heme/copper-type cytochrome/quinol oxidase subunit 2
VKEVNMKKEILVVTLISSIFILIFGLYAYFIITESNNIIDLLFVAIPIILILVITHVGNERIKEIGKEDKNDYSNY